MSTESTDQYFQNLSEKSQENLREAITRIVEVKKRNGKIMIVTGSGPNIHEGVTTLIAELMGKDIIDSVTTSSAVIAHEMGGSLDKVKRISAADVGFNPDSHFLPKGGVFELSLMSDEAMTELGNEMVLDNEIIQKAKKAEGDIIIKAAGNMAYPMGLYCENLSNEILTISQTYGLPFETVAGWGADRKTML
ncbi:MAG: hypothetical protein DRP60_14530, partial [Spirochaetes bacterium]